MTRTIRYGEYLGAIRRHHRRISYSDVAQIDRTQPPARHRPAPAGDALVSVRFAEQFRAVVPLALMLVGFQALALRATPEEAEHIAVGVCAVMLGLMFFMEGVKLGLMPFAENIGFLMPGRSPVLTVLGFGALLGTAATFAEPAIGVLQAAAGSVSELGAPLLKSMLGPRAGTLVVAVAGGVGLGGASPQRIGPPGL